MSSRSRSRPPSMLVTVIILIIGGALYLFQSTQPKTENPTLAAPTLSSSTSIPDQGGMPAWLKVYFTDPNPPDNLGNGIDRFVQADLDGAQQTIDVTSFDLNLPSLVNALADAEKRGVKVRVVYDGTNGSLDVNNAASGNQPFEAIQVLSAAKAGLVNGGRSSGLMHDKMVIIDGKILYMGSWNLSYNDSYRNNNNLLRITDSRLIANYQAKFNELFVDKRFGTHAQVQAPNPNLTIDGVAVENYFAPEGGVMAKLVALVQGAHQSVHYMIFTFTHKDLSDALIARSKAGLDVEGVIEDRGASQGALVPLFCAKLPVKVDGNKYTMHHKVIILDGNTVVTGSFNFTQSADKENDDNLIIIHSAAVAAAYEQEFQKIYGQGKSSTADLKCK